jgi:glycine cleavage system H protein
MARRTLPSDEPRPADALGTLPADGQACVWMRAKVLTYRVCDRDFDCEHCPLDAALHGSTSREEPTVEPNGARLFPQDRRFASNHTWVYDLTANTVRVGVDALVAWLLAEATDLALPLVGGHLDYGDLLGTLSTGGEQLKIPAPVAGRVTARNEAALACPQLVVAAPFRAGWLLELALDPGTQEAQTSRLLRGPEMERLSRGHMHRFYRHLDAVLDGRQSPVGATLADGGTLLADPRTILGPPRYLALVQELLT